MRVLIMPRTFTRREFMKASAMGAGAVVVSHSLAACAPNQACLAQWGAIIPTSFNHGVASGDPTQDRVLLWTRITPELNAAIPISWEVATDELFENITHEGATLTTEERDYILKVDIVGLSPGSTYYYRFRTSNAQSPTGRTRTLPQGAVDHLKMAVFSCSNLSFGYFHAYQSAALMDDIDIALHLGDYIYEYPRGQYPKKPVLGRETDPQHELLTLQDYRQRYARYRRDGSLQAVHATMPFICVWDDHEIANNTWRGGAENHDESEGDFGERSLAALQAYFEWLPIRPRTAIEFEETIYRSFDFGDLVSLHMLDTRFIGRDEQLSYKNYTHAETGEFDADGFKKDVTARDRTLLGAEQMSWLKKSVRGSKSKWQVLGQQVLMGKYYLPAALVLRTMTLADYTLFARLLGIQQKIDSRKRLTNDEKALYKAEAGRLTPDAIAAFQAESLPYNLDAWDGYAQEQEEIYSLMAESLSSFVTLAGDTHNAWSSYLVDKNGTRAGLEFAVQSVSSPGLESFLNIAPEAAPAVEESLTGLIENLNYLNARDRGFMTVAFSADKVRTEWHFVSDVTSQDYHMLSDRNHVIEADRNLRI